MIRPIADTAGAVVIPKKAEDGWTLKPRFPVSPWNIGSAYADAIVHFSMVIDKSVQWQPAPLYDTVFVSGINVGKGVEVTRAGQGGLKPGTDVFEPWLVATDVNKERGRQILAASGNHALIDIITSVPDSQVAPGLIEPGDVLEYQDHDETEKRHRQLPKVTHACIQKRLGPNTKAGVRRRERLFESPGDRRQLRFDPGHADAGSASADDLKIAKVVQVFTYLGDVIG